MKSKTKLRKAQHLKRMQQITEAAAKKRLAKSLGMELDSSNNLVSTKPTRKVSSYKHEQPYVRETKNYPSLSSDYYNCYKAEPKVYTGTLIKGIAQMHKSNAVPIINQQQAIEIAQMRRN